MSRHVPPRRVRFAGPDKAILVMDWPDGHVSAYPLDYLRGWCPCAACQGHFGPPHFVPVSGARLTALKQVGAYALGLTWADGHASGIHAFEGLRAECPCPACGGPRAGTPERVVVLVAEALEAATQAAG